MSTMLRTGAVAVVACLAVTVALADDLVWSDTTGPFVYDQAGSWTPNQVPAADDNVFFSILITPEPLIIIGSPKPGLQRQRDRQRLDVLWRGRCNA